MSNKIFFCIHQSFIINLEYIKRHIKGKAGAVVMENEHEIQVPTLRKVSRSDACGLLIL